jgi:hypothetical protein
MQHISQFAVPAVVILLVLYRRVRRTIGFQKANPGRLGFRIGLFALVGLLLLGAGFVHPILYLADAAGIVCGIALALLAVKYCTFETRGPDLYYRTHIGIEAAVLALFIGRIVYRLFFLFAAGPQTSSDPAAMQQWTKDPWTAVIFFILVSYYIGYYGFVLRECRKHTPSENLH